MKYLLLPVPLTFHQSSTTLSSGQLWKSERRCEKIWIIKMLWFWLQDMSSSRMSRRNKKNKLFFWTKLKNFFFSLTTWKLMQFIYFLYVRKELIFAIFCNPQILHVCPFHLMPMLLCCCNCIRQRMENFYLFIL